MKTSLILSLSFLFFAACAPATPSTTESPSPDASASPAAPSDNDGDDNSSQNSELRYLGLTRDLVPAAVSGGPDGKADHEFQLSHTFDGDTTIKAVTISRIENGRPNGVAGWTTSSSKQYWVLKVLANGTELNANSKSVSVNKQVSNNVNFEFFGSDAPAFQLAKAGTEYELSMTYSDATGADQIITRRVTL